MVDTNLKEQNDTQLNMEAMPETVEETAEETVNEPVIEAEENVDEQEEGTVEIPAEAPAEEAVKAVKKKRPGFLAGIFLGAVLAAAAFVLIRGYASISLGKYGSLVVKLPYYDKLYGAASGRLDPVEINRKMNEIEHLIDKTYLYTADPQTMSDGMFTGMIYGLDEDKYATYYSKTTFENESVRMQGSYVGIGVTIQKDAKTGGLLIGGLSTEGPAQKAGLEIGDIILEADGVDLTVKDIDEAVTYVKGEEGTSVVLKVQRREETFEVSVERKTITDTTVRGKVLSYANENIGYVSITSFTNITEEEFYSEMDELVENRNVEGVVIDLRNNGGGDMNVCLRMLDSILKDDDPRYNTEDTKDADKGKTLLLSIEDKNGGGEKYYSDDGWSQKIPIVVVVNGKSASASEIFAGALKDYGYDIVGEKTFGKGIVQSLYELSDGSAVKFTTDHYILPGGELIHGVGIEPTVSAEFVEYDGITADMVNWASGKESDTEKDVQIQAAVELLEHEINKK